MPREMKFLFFILCLQGRSSTLLCQAYKANLQTSLDERRVEKHELMNNDDIKQPISSDRLEQRLEQVLAADRVVDDPVGIH